MTKKTEEHWDLPAQRRVADLEVGESVWIARCYRGIREIKENTEGRLLLLDGMSYFVLVPSDHCLWWMQHPRPDTPAVQPDDRPEAQEEKAEAQA